MRKPTAWIIKGIAFAVLAGCAWLLLTMPAEGNPHPDTHAGPKSAGRVVEPGTESAATGNAPSENSAGIGSLHTRIDTASEGNTSDITRAVVVGRCIDEAGKPLPELVVSVDLARPTSAWLRASQAEGLPWSQTTWAETDEEGKFLIAFVTVPDTPFGLSLEPMYTNCCRCRFDELLLGDDARLDLGEVLLPLGGSVSGTLVDTLGQPVRYAAVRLSPKSSILAAPALGRFTHKSETTTDPTGAFALDGPIPSGTWQVSVAGREFATPEQSVLQVNGDVTELRLVVQSMATSDTIRGIVVRDNDEPIAGVVVSAPLIAGPTAALSMYEQQESEPTDAEGRFTLMRRADAKTQPVRLKVDGPDYPSVMYDATAWNDHNVRIVIRRKASLRVRARAAATGQPVRMSWVRVVIPGRGSFNYNAQVPVPSDAPSESVFTGIISGELLLHFDTSRHGTYPPPAMRVTLKRGEELLVELNLASSSKRSIHVATTSGAPVHPGGLYLFDNPSLSESDARILAQPSGWSKHRWPSSRARIPIRLAESATDVNGHGQLRGPTDRAVSLMVQGAGWYHVVSGVRFDDTGPLEVVVPEPARVILNLHPMSAVRMDPQLRINPHEVVLRNVGESGEPQLMMSANPDANSRVEFTSLGSGSWDVRLRNNTSQGMSSLWREVTIHRIANLRLGEIREVDLDLSAFIPRLVTGRVELNAQPAARTELQFFRIDETTGKRSGRAAGITNLQGEFSLPLRAGRWIPMVKIPGPSELRASITTEPSELVVEESTITDVSLAATSALGTFIVRNQDGTPASGIQVRWTRDGEAHHLDEGCSGLTDASGRAQLLQAPGRYRASVLKAKFRNMSPFRELRGNARRAAIAAASMEIGTLQLIARNNQAETILRMPESAKD